MALRSLVEGDADLSDALSLAQRTVSTSMGKVNLLGAAVLSAIFFLPLVGNDFNRLKRKIAAYRQDILNQRIMRDRTYKIDTEERAKQLEDRAVALHAQARNHMGQAENSSMRNKMKYLLTFLAPMTITPQIAMLTSVTFAAPAAVALGGVATLLRYHADRRDAAEEYAAAQVAETQAREFEAEAGESQRLLENKNRLAALQLEKMALQIKCDGLEQELQQTKDNHKATMTILTSAFNKRDDVGAPAVEEAA